MVGHAGRACVLQAAGRAGSRVGAWQASQLDALHGRTYAAAEDEDEGGGGGEEDEDGEKDEVVVVVGRCDAVGLPDDRPKGRLNPLAATGGTCIVASFGLAQPVQLVRHVTRRRRSSHDFAPSGQP